MPTEKIFSPESLDAALGLLNEYGADLLVLAGGTLAMQLINEGLTSPQVVMTLHRARLNEARAANNHFEIGATTTLTRVAQMDVPLLSQAAKSVGSWSVRNMATLAGNLFAPPPAGDAATALLALDAEALCVRKNRERRIPLDQFFTGLMQTILAPNELVTKIIVPKPRGKTAYLKFGRRHANTPAVVTVAVQVMQDGKGVCTDARVALGAAADFPMRAKKAEAALKGRALDAKSIADASALAMEEAKPFTDALATEWYRRKMVGVFVRRALEGLK